MIIALQCEPHDRFFILEQVEDRYDSVHEEVEGQRYWTGCTRLNEPALIICEYILAPLPDISRYDVILAEEYEHPEAHIVTTFEEIETLLRLRR